MKFLELEVRTALIVHGYDEHNREITEQINDPAFANKLIALERIQSVSEQYVLVTGSHGRIMYWEYRGTLEQLRGRLAEAGLMLPMCSRST
ncbi:hypothetical protein PVT68_10150 [Microbulbifer bruguierae]|uniref:Uncharacterized protein n=1 Tax=Microbulbifer bruguierae TaxID=3029061 RepID=A0ABY8N8A4_9GAMM|nr:hypothetical protein [Microbulbifer bruguierae]WGL15136.1 hypothetical protein PVT68_10150 [Microbulbifer bruguierae]